MNPSELAALLRRRRLLFLATLIVGIGVVVAVTLVLPKTYEATATLYVGTAQKGNLDTTLDTSQGEQLSRTYTTLASNPAVADDTLPQLSIDLTRSELLDRLSFAPIERTQLLQITAKGATPDEAAGIANTYADTFVSRVDQLVDEGRAPTAVSVSEPATPPSSAASPNVPLYITLGSFVALLLAFGAALLYDRLDRRLLIPEDADSFLDQPILGRLPDSFEVNTLGAEPAPRIGDALRVLRTNLELAPGASVRTLLVTSPEPAEGKTTVAANLALAIARDGDSVALIECDLRRPTLDLSRVGPGLSTTGPGLASYLAGEIDRDAIAHSDAYAPTLTVVYAGSLDILPARLLRSARLGELLRELREHNSWVIIDTPPISIGDDALALTPQVDGTILVVDATSSSLPSVRASLNQLRNVGARVLGTMINRAPVSRSSGYYHYAVSAARSAGTGAVDSGRETAQSAAPPYEPD